MIFGKDDFRDYEGGKKNSVFDDFVDFEAELRESGKMGKLGSLLARLLAFSLLPVMLPAMLRSRTFWQLFGTFAVLVLASVIFLGGMVAGWTKQNGLQQIKETLRAHAVIIREYIQEMLRDATPDKTALLTRHLQALESKLSTGSSLEMRVTLIRKDGIVLADSQKAAQKMENHGDRPEIAEARGNRFGVATRPSTTMGKAMMYGALTTDDPQGDVLYVRVALPLSAVEDKVAELKYPVWTAACMAAMVALILAFLVARRITRPLQELTAGAEEIARGAFGRRLVAHGESEVAQLARTFNYMSQCLADQFAQLENDRQQVRAVLSSMVEGVVALDSEQRVLFANERAGTLLDFPIQPAVGRHFGELVRQRSLQELVQHALRDPAFDRQELSSQHPGARSFAVHVGRLPGAPPRGIVLVFHDISDLRRLERLRQEFVANVSHELKTPLSVITACIETLMDGAVEDRENRGPFLQSIAEQAERLHNLILDLLSLARIESETEAFVMQGLSIPRVVTACLERHRTVAEGKNQALEAVPTTPDARGGVGPVQAWADDEAVRQILDNLVDNALKYTPSGGTVRVRWGQDGDQVFLQVEDTGIGIPEAELPRIFERFYRVDKARSRELGGTGLGLSIVKHLAQAMQGSVSARSKVGEGSTFTVRLPAWTGSGAHG
jgi:two-component system phosphate regulon sensor histidine kinase PhoR